MLLSKRNEKCSLASVEADAESTPSTGGEVKKIKCFCVSSVEECSGFFPALRNTRMSAAHELLPIFEL